MNPEAHARQEIDANLTLAGWVVQDVKDINLGASLDVAVREFQTDVGPCD
jgi:type I restriction enzyme R subunit